MEHRYHPTNFKKNKTNDIKDSNLILDKKINNNVVEKKNNNHKETKEVVTGVKDKNKIPFAMDEKMSEISKSSHKNAIRSVGAPFFKKEGNSESSRKTAPITTNIESDESGREENEHKVVNEQPQTKRQANRKKSLFLLSEDEIWRNNTEEGHNWVDKKVD